MSDRSEAPAANAGEHSADWRALNRANWDERVPIHMRSKSYDLGPLRDGRGRLNAIEEAERFEEVHVRTRPRARAMV